MFPNRISFWHFFQKNFPVTLDRLFEESTRQQSSGKESFRLFKWRQCDQIILWKKNKKHIFCTNEQYKKIKI
jgi:hypothetical protein